MQHCVDMRLIADIRTQKCLPDNLHVFQLPFSKLYLHHDPDENYGLGRLT